MKREIEDEQADVNGIDIRFGRTALHATRRRGRPHRLDMMRFLIQSGASVNVLDIGNDSPLNLFIRDAIHVPMGGIHKSLRCIKLLIQADADLNRPSMVVDAISNLPILQCLVEAGCRTDLISTSGRTPYGMAHFIDPNSATTTYLALRLRVRVRDTLMCNLPHDVPVVLIDLIADFVTLL